MFRQQLAQSLAAVLLESLVSQGGLLIRDWELSQRLGAVNADFAGAKSLDQLRCAHRVRGRIHIEEYVNMLRITELKIPPKVPLPNPC
jgi:hypothetical protein